MLRYPVASLSYSQTNHTQKPNAHTCTHAHTPHPLFQKLTQLLLAASALGEKTLWQDGKSDCTAKQNQERITLHG